MSAQVEKYTLPVQELNALAVDNIEKLVNLQLKQFEETAKVSIEQLKAASAVKDPEGFKDFLNNFAEAARHISEQSVDNMRAVFELGNIYTTEARRIFKDTLKVN